MFSRKWGTLFLGWSVIWAPLAGFAQQQETPPAAHAPRLVCEEPTFNFGEKDSSEVVKHVFVVKNEGDLTLEITRVRPSCGCTVASVSCEQVPPGETAEISAEFSLKGRSGQQHKNIRVENNDPTNQNFMLYLEGNIITELSIEPAHLYLGQITPSQVVSQTVTVASLKDLVITSVTSTVPCLMPNLEVIEPGRKYRITATTKPPLEMGTQQGELRLYRESGEEIIIPLSVVIVGPLTYAPKELVVRADDQNASTRYIIVRPGEVRDFEITGVEVPDETIQASVTALGTSGYRIQVGNIQGNQSLDGKNVVIHTSTEQMPVIEIPFKIIPVP